MKSAQRATSYWRRFIFEVICIFLVQSNSMALQKAMIQNLEFIADKEALKI
jgi:hypothetical protein